MRFHLLGLPHTQIAADFSSCAFSAKGRNFAKVLRLLGHEAILYAGDRTDAPVDELVPCFTEAERVACLAGAHYTAASWNFEAPHWRAFNERAAAAIRQRAGARDIVCAFGGRAHQAVAAALPDLMTIEPGIGYGGTFARYRVWESYAWMHACYGAATKGDACAADGAFFDAVIPGFLDPADFPLRETPDDYFLFIGRLTERKGFRIAVETCRAIGARLVVAGPGEPPDGVDYVGVVGPEERGRLMAGATAVFAPTTYLEPFGMVAIEAQACGTPAITTDWGAFVETVQQGVTGYRCRTLAEFVDAARACREGGLDRRHIRRQAVARYSLEAVAPLYQAYFDRLTTLWAAGWYELPTERLAA